jgi:signal transduction histidine kinase
MQNVDPILRPLTQNFNAMVTRLEELEQEHVMRELDLTEQVEDATRTLLEQQRSLANTERLAAVGETMARIAHELRNPLAGVKLACSNLREEIAEKIDTPDYQERIALVSGEIDRIIDLLNSLLDESRHKPEELNSVNLSSTIRSLVILARYQIPESIAVNVDIPDAIDCQLPASLFRQALLNLLLNASQAITDRHGQIKIEASAEGGMVKLTVRDDGPGFPQELVKQGIRVFVSYKPGGTGLGLSMVRRFVRSIGGTLQLNNLDPKGACVTMNLPCGETPNA